MPVQVPERLVDVPLFHQQRSLEVVSAGSAALGEIAARSYDPTTGEYGANLDVIHRDIIAALDDVFANTRTLVTESEQVVNGLVTGDAATRWLKALRAPSAQSAAAEVGRAPVESQAALRAGLDQYIFNAALRAPSLQSGTTAITNYASPYGKDALRFGFEQHVYDKAYRAPSLQSAIIAINNYAAFYGAVLRRGLDRRVLSTAQTAPSLQSGTTAIGNYASSPAEKANMRTAFDTQVEAKAQEAPSLQSATTAISNYGSTPAVKDAMRTRLNDRVQREAFAATSSSSALRIAGNYGYGPGQEMIRRNVAAKWLPTETATLTNRKESLEAAKKDLEEIKELSPWQRLLKVRESRKLKADIKTKKLLVNLSESNVQNLKGILQVQ